MRHIRDDLQRVPMPADAVVVELRLHARLVDEVLGCAAAEHDRRRARPPDDEIRRLDDVADDVDQAGARVAMPRLRDTHANRRVRDRRAEDRDAGTIRRREDPFLLRLLPEILTEPVEKFARRVRPALERQHERGDPLVVIDELVLLGIRVVHAIDVLRLQRRIVFARRADVVAATARLVEIVVQIGAGRNEAVDVAVLDQVRDDHPQSTGAERARHTQEDRAVVAEHLLPDAARGREVAPLKRNALHARQHLVCRQSGLDGERFNRRAKKT